MKIKFSHMYHKMPNDYSPSRLIQTFLIDRKDLSKEFVEYDTCTLEYEYYKLPTGKLIILILLTEYGHLWTTIRRYTPEKYRYYNSNIGREFDIEIS